MKKTALLLFLLLPLAANGKADVNSSTEAAVTCEFVAESEMQDSLLQMLARFSEYMKADFQPCAAPNSLGEECGCFRGENTMGPDERGVRPNADLSMICAFLVKYAKPSVTLPPGVTWDDLESMAMKSLVFAYSTHKANRLKVCAGDKYWGSTSEADHVWESSLWAMSVAYSAFFQWHRLTEEQKQYIYQLLKAECNYELKRTIPTGYSGDTKAEENGWEADVLAATLGLFPDDPLARQWFERLRLFAINSYSHRNDATDQTVVDPDYDQMTVSDLYRGQNLYDDYTLQNHNYFHTSYQNVVIQELGEAALALKLFQRDLHGHERWKTNALMHNCQEVMDSVLYHLALPDGELAMPNGNDWSLFLYDQITSYTTNACFLRDPHALMLENQAYKQIRSRQLTTPDGSWLLRPDVGARRMGVQAHRVMMTWLMHHLLPTASLTPTSWKDFNTEYAPAKVFPSQDIVCASNEHRFACFSWSHGLKSYIGYIAPNSPTPQLPNSSNLIVPFRSHNTGNFLGWYEVEGRKTNAVPVLSSPNYLLPSASCSHIQQPCCSPASSSWVINGELQTNDDALNHRFAIYSTPGNPVIYLDNVTANDSCTITASKGGLMAVSTDDMTYTTRSLYTAGNASEPYKLLDGSTFTTIASPWVNVDNTFGIISFQSRESSLSNSIQCKESSLSNSTTNSPTKIAFGDRTNVNSVMTALLFASYSDQRRTVANGDLVDCRAIAYYSNTSADTTDSLYHEATLLTHTTPEGWNGIIVPDSPSPQLPYYMLLSHFTGTKDQCTIRNYRNQAGSPVFTVPTVISTDGSTATFTAEQNHSVANTLLFFIQGSGIEAVQSDGDPTTIHLKNLSKGKNTITITALCDGKAHNKKVTMRQQLLTATLRDGNLLITTGHLHP